MKKERAAKPIKTVAVMMAATVLSKALGMLRSMVLAANYGTGTEANAISAASRIPLSFFDLLLSAAIVGCFIPAYNSFGKEEDGRKRADRFAVSFLTLVIIVTGGISVLGMIFAEPLVAVITPGLEPETKALAAVLLRIMFPMIIFAGAAFTLVGVMQSKGRFYIPAMISAVSNAAVIIYLLFIDKNLGDASVYGLAAAYLAAWIIQFLTLAIPLALDGFGRGAKPDIGDPAIRSALKNAPPIMLGSCMLPVAALVGTFFASYINDEAVTVFEFANNTFIIIAGVLTYSTCNYLFPKLSRISADGEEFADCATRGLVSIITMAVPVVAAVILLSKEAVAVLYMRGEFTAAAAEKTATMLAVLSAGIIGFAVYEFMSRVFISKNLPRIPMYAAAVGAAANILLSALLVFTSDSGENAFAAIGAANAVGQTAAAVVLLVAAGVKIKGFYKLHAVMEFVFVAFSGAVSFAVMKLVYSKLLPAPFEYGVIKNIIIAALTFAAGLAAYLAINAFRALTSKKRR